MSARQQAKQLFEYISHVYAIDLPVTRDVKLPQGQRKSLEDLLGLLRDKSGPAVLKITIPWKLKYEIMCDLRRMNITAASLYPGIDGFARSLNFLASGYRAVDAITQVTE